MTKLFVYGFALEKYKLYDLKEKISLICSGAPVLENEKSYQTKTTLQLFKEYIVIPEKLDKVLYLGTL